FNGPVTISLGNPGTNPGGGTLGSTLTVFANNGVADFSDLTLDKRGTGYTLQASSNGMTLVTTNAFNVVDQLVVKLQPPANVLAGAPFEAVLEADGAHGQADLTFTGQVTVSIASNPGGGALSGTLLTVPVLNGIADFPDLSVDQPGTGYTLQARGDGLSP